MTRSPQTIQVVCPLCQATMSVPAVEAGTITTCSNCLEDFTATPVATRTSPATPHNDDDALQRLLHPALDVSPAAEETIRLDDELSDEVYPTKRRQVIERDYEFSVACMICGTRIDVNDALIGKKIKCPDCHNPIAIRTPAPDQRRAPFHAAPAVSDDDDFGLSEVTSSAALTSPYHSLANDLLARAESEVARETPIVPRQPRVPVSDSLQRAEDDRGAADAQERPPLPKAPFRTGLLNFLPDPQTIARLIVLAFVLFLELGAIQRAIESAQDDDPQSQFVSIISRIFAVTLGALFATNFAVSLLGILQDTANGKDVIETWPDINFMDWIGEAMYFFSGLFIAVFPTCVAAQLVSLLGLPDSVFWVVCIVGSSASVLFLFPFVLISMLESASPIVPVSVPIIRSLRLARGRWFVFTLVSSLLLAIGVCLGGVRVCWPNYSVLNFVIALLLVVVLAIYFRLLGRLTWCCDEAVLAEDIRLEEASGAS